MINFWVEDLGRDGHRISLRDQHGQLHVARVSGPAPEVGDALFGQEALLGTRVLVQQESNKPLPVHFEALACTQSQALDLLHPLPDPTDAPDASQGRLPAAAAAAAAVGHGAARWAGPSLD